ncbi:hypothetical protein MHLP_04060 [Candidatus Mycoplasma haematolamae str. Purdue]|uniref:Uncharacterized protein n=1 Tax=Mycoplasma haematolamae (strain Purdue) TaxID=1212765 RepID=I7C753_MYCHA|nr:hypothetical protein [Candidatus Mycoplasma haematolamae]AFO52392.1 hypothetical protein MHLP_04060 [Candidatus Mycoplasma haematolamae str. Purdue]
MISFFKPLTCAFLGFWSTTGIVYGGYRVASGGGHPTYHLGNKYCLKSASNVCIIFGKYGDGFRTPGVWVDPGTAQATQGIETETHLQYHDIKGVVPKLFAEYSGLESFTKKKIKEYQDKGCKYEDKQEQKEGSGFNLYHVMTCTVGSP